MEGKALFSFGANEGSFKVLKDAVHGEVYDIDVVKNTAGYNDWVSAKKSDGSTPTSASPSHGTTGGGASGASKSTYTASKSSYPTDEERAKTQVYIVRQSNITAAINTLSVGAKTPPKVSDILATAKLYEDHVFGNSNDDVGAPVSADGFADLDDLPQ